MCVCVCVCVCACVCVCVCACVCVCDGGIYMYMHIDECRTSLSASTQLVSVQDPRTRLDTTYTAQNEQRLGYQTTVRFDIDEQLTWTDEIDMDR